MSSGREFLVKKNKLAECHWQKITPEACAAGEVTFQVDSFALTANNITYAVAGDQMSYWQFFPANDGWGKIPVWGFANVVESQAEGITTGSRYYGYFPMSSHLTVQAGKLNSRGFSDIAANRASLSPIYNAYHLQGAPDANAADKEARHMLFQPLFTTAFLLSDFFEANQHFGATAIILTSASSKTSISLAYQLRQKGAVKVLGLTSAENKTFVEGLGFYDAVYCYDQIDTIAQEPVLTVDMAGNSTVLAKLHTHFDENLKYSCLVGMTHWESRGAAKAAQLKGVKPELFFAPTHAQQRAKDWGPEVLSSRIEAAMKDFSENIGEWMSIEFVDGADAITACYKNMLEGKTSPATGYILKP